MIQKHDLPILEYDFDSIEVIRPNHGAEQLVLPEKCVFGFLGDVIDDYAFEMDAVIAEHFETITKSYPVYIVQQNGLEFCLCQAPLGAAAAAQLLDFLISCGCKKIISAGSCGVLTDLDENEFLIPIRAMRDEGTSYHYLPAARFVDLEPSAIKAIEQTFCALNIPFQKCITWTTDGFFRETRDMVEYRKSEGCATVEMESLKLLDEAGSSRLSLAAEGIFATPQKARHTAICRQKSAAFCEMTLEKAFFTRAVSGCISGVVVLDVR